MAGQLSAAGAQALVNTIAGIVPPYIGTSAPVWQPGLLWVDTSSGAVLNYWNGSAWVAGTEPRYLALLTGDPTLSGPNGGYAESISDLIEDTTAGYARQAVTFASPVPYLAGTAYTAGEQVTYDGYLYSAISATTGNAPTGAETSNTYWTWLGSAYPAPAYSTAALTFSYTAAQAAPVQWGALVTAASGDLGLLLYMWALPSPEQVGASQSIQIAAGSVTLDEA